MWKNALKISHTPRYSYKIRKETFPPDKSYSVNHSRLLCLPFCLPYMIKSHCLPFYLPYLNTPPSLPSYCICHFRLRLIAYHFLYHFKLRHKCTILCTISDYATLLTILFTISDYATCSGIPPSYDQALNTFDGDGEGGGGGHHHHRRKQQREQTNHQRGHSASRQSRPGSAAAPSSSVPGKRPPSASASTSGGQFSQPKPQEARSNDFYYVGEFYG